MTVNNIYIPAEPITGSFFIPGPGVVYLPRTAGKALNSDILWQCSPDTPRLDSITVNRAGDRNQFIHITVSVGGHRLLDAQLSDGDKDFSISAPSDARVPDGAHLSDLKIRLSPTHDLTATLAIKSIDLTFTD